MLHAKVLCAGERATGPDDLDVVLKGQGTLPLRGVDDLDNGDEVVDNM